MIRSSELPRPVHGRSILVLFVFVSLCVGLARPVPAQDLPRRILVGYWHNWGFSPNNLTLANLPDEYDVVNVSFAIPSTPFGSVMVFSPDPQLYPNAAQFQLDIQSLQAQGKKVLISVGGATGPVHLNNATDVSNFVTSMVGILMTYGFDGLDIDLEGSSLSLAAGDTDFRTPTSPRIVNFIAAINQILALMPSDFLLTAAPETAPLQGAVSAYGGVWGAYLPVIHALRSQLDWVQVQHYNTGSMFGRDGNLYQPGTADFHVAMADMLISGFYVPAAGVNFPPLAPEQVVIGLPASTSAAGSGFTSSSVVQTALDHLYLGKAGGSSYQLGNPDGYEDFRGLMTWSINWDVDAGAIFSQSHGHYLEQLHLAADTQTVSSATGGMVNLSLRAGVAHAGRFYYLVPTISGTMPGTWLPGNRFFPINFDAISNWPFQAGTAGYFTGFAGLLDAQGEASASFFVPTMAGLGSFRAHYAFILDYPWEFFSDPVAIDFVP